MLLDAAPALPPRLIAPEHLVKLHLEPHRQAIFDDPLGELARGQLLRARREQHLAAVGQRMSGHHRTRPFVVGAIDIGGVDPRVSRVVDLKTPASGEMHRNRLENLPLLTPHDQLKFVVCDRADYEWARAIVAGHALADRCEVLFSPSAQQLPARDLAEWIIEDRLPVRFQMQLHKVLWGDQPGR